MTDYNDLIVDKLEKTTNQYWNNLNVLNSIKKALSNSNTEKSLALKNKLNKRIRLNKKRIYLMRTAF